MSSFWLRSGADIQVVAAKFRWTNGPAMIKFYSMRNGAELSVASKSLKKQLIENLKLMVNKEDRILLEMIDPPRE